MSGEWILAIDQGTTNTKAVLVDREGRIVFRDAVPLEILQPQLGFVEQDPLALWQSVVQVMSACVRHAQSEGASIVGIAISNQRETTVAWRQCHHLAVPAFRARLRPPSRARGNHSIHHRPPA
jgi:glycerol kinase